MGTNLYLAKVSMDIVAKHTKPNENGVRIAGLDEMLYRKMLWNHTPITDFWDVYKRQGYYVDTVGKNAKRIAEYVRNQLREDMMYDQISIKEYKDPFNGS